MGSTSTTSPSPDACATCRRPSDANGSARTRKRGADGDRVCLDAIAVRQLDRGDATVVARHDPTDALHDDRHTGRTQRVEVGVVGIDAVVQHQRVPVGELAEEDGGVEVHPVRDHVDDTTISHLETVTERAVDHVATPVLGHAGDVGQHVDQARGREHTSSDDGMPAGELDTEPVVVGTADVDGTPGDDLTAVAAHLLAGERQEVRRRQALVSEVAVHVGGGSVAWFAGVDDDDAPALTSELERGGEAGRRSADDGDVAVALDGA